MHSADVRNKGYPSWYGVLAEYDMFRRHSSREEGDGAVDPEGFFYAGVEKGKAPEVVECGLVAAGEDREDFCACGRLVFRVLGEVIYRCG